MVCVHAKVHALSTCGLRYDTQPAWEAVRGYGDGARFWIALIRLPAAVDLKGLVTRIDEAMLLECSN